jgi:transposase
MHLRRLIAGKLPSYESSGEVEVDECYFGGTRKGKQGRGASGKVAVFGLLKGGGKVFTAIVPNARTETLLPIIEEKVTPDSIAYTDSFKSYNALDVSDFYHMRINHSELFADRGNHINGIENFWNQAKRHLRKFNGINKVSFYWFLKECEWCFNGGNHQSLYKQLKQWY